MSYIVKNCPACIISPSCCAKYHIDNGHAKDCQDIKDCVIKQMIEKCNIYKNFTAITINDYAKRELALHILDLFDIEEINK
jgi:hypothetical protein